MIGSVTRSNESDRRMWPQDFPEYEHASRRIAYLQSQRLQMCADENLLIFVDFELPYVLRSECSPERTDHQLRHIFFFDTSRPFSEAPMGINLMVPSIDTPGPVVPSLPALHCADWTVKLPEVFRSFCK